jgi:hypothetical protein
MPKVRAADVAWSKSPPGIHDFRVVAMPHHKCAVDRHVDRSAVQGLPVKVTCDIPTYPYDAGIVLAVIFDPRRREQRAASVPGGQTSCYELAPADRSTCRPRIAVKRAFTPR